MTQSDHTIVGIHVRERGKQALEIQRVLTEFGDVIKTRLGLHEVDDKVGKDQGLILLELVGEPARVAALIGKLRRCAGVTVRKMVFTH